MEVPRGSRIKGKSLTTSSQPREVCEFRSISVRHSSHRLKHELPLVQEP